MHRICCRAAILAMRSWDIVSLQLFMQKCADTPTSVHTQHIFRALCMGFPPAGLLTRAPLPPRCLRLRAVPPRLSRCGKLAAKTGLEGASRGASSHLLLQPGSLGVGCSNWGPCRARFEILPSSEPLLQCLTILRVRCFCLSDGNFLCSHLCLVPSAVVL